MRPRTIDKIRALVREQRYEISTHANEEMSDDELTSLDVEQAILTGEIDKRFTRDPRGVRYEVVGRALDSRSIAVVCRMPPTNWLRIITVYEAQEGEL
ncbi:MAG: DUF4258 domain-containing protein [Acidobacteriota bacterium]